MVRKWPEPLIKLISEGCFTSSLLLWLGHTQNPDLDKRQKKIYNSLQILKIKYGYAQSFASTSTSASAKQEFLELDHWSHLSISYSTSPSPTSLVSASR